jgi:hypothetical protein
MKTSILDFLIFTLKSLTSFVKHELKVFYFHHIVSHKHNLFHSKESWTYHTSKSFCQTWTEGLLVSSHKHNIFLYYFKNSWTYLKCIIFRQNERKVLHLVSFHKYLL